jgi:hypothetical protein
MRYHDIQELENSKIALTCPFPYRVGKPALVSNPDELPL